ncbi:MAG: DNA-processing protein DprA, partial [Gammaproteobacteria bacterium]|nr:DNA-processing protein DprA [Gammaproteobacteria bacterium]
MNDVKDWLILLRATGHGAAGFHKLLDRFGSPEKTLAASRGQFSELGFNSQTIAAIQQPDLDAVQLDLEWLNAADNHHILTLLDPQYPPQLKSIVHPPPVLFVRGDPDYLQQPQLAMVGSRNPTAAGRRTASDFAKYLSTSGITITSGLASGIDGASHQGALQGIAGTIALVAHGLDIVYPAAHRALAEEIANHGAGVSEMPIGTEPHRGLFPRRYRIISGISLGTL